MARLNLRPDPVTHSFSFSWNRKKESKTKRGERKTERKSESEAGQKGGKGERRRKPGDICS